MIRIGPHGSFEERIKQCQGNLAARDLGSENVDHGSPTIIVVAASAVIANNLGKELRGLSKVSQARNSLAASLDSTNEKVARDALLHDLFPCQRAPKCLATLSSANCLKLFSTGHL